MKTVLALSSAALSITLMAGCMSRDAQLEAVARDWCMTIRASQIIPVYPLTEDVQPGDIFLVQVPVDQQQVLYKKRGFLALDNHLARLNPDEDYEKFYSHSFLNDAEEAKKRLPANWIRPGGDLDAWSPAPNAAFPSYAFSTSKGAGFNLALPISGVPVGLSLMGAQSANGSITIDKTNTLGVDILSLHAKLKTWANTNRLALTPFGPASGETKPRNYLRIISRVYSTGRVNIALSDARSVSGGADVGVPRPVDLITAKAPSSLANTNESTIDNYNRNLANLNAGLAESLRPTRVSGSNAGLSLEEIDAKTAASKEASEAYRANAVKEVDAQKKGLADAKSAGDPKFKAEAEAKAAYHAKVKEAEKTKASLEEAQERLELAEKKHDDAVRSHGAESNEAKQAATDLEKARKEHKDAETAHATAITAAESASTAYEGAKKDAAADYKSVATAQGKLDAARSALDSVAQVVPGGSLRVTAASSRFITMREDFDPPLVIGYLAFDIAILANGEIGPPIPTHSQLDPEQAGRANEVEEPANELSGVDEEYRSLLKDADETGQSEGILTLTAAKLGRQWETAYSRMRAGSGNLTPRETFGDVRSVYLNADNFSKDARHAALNKALRDAINEVKSEKKKQD
jgi:hypothetical protein